LKTDLIENRGAAGQGLHEASPQTRNADRQTLRSLIKVSGQFETSVGIGLKSDDRGDGADIERPVDVRIKIPLPPSSQWISAVTSSSPGPASPREVLKSAGLS
jgi:hypothetical protein